MRLGSFGAFLLTGAAFLGLASGLGGCASILGIDSYESANGGAGATGATSTTPTSGPTGPGSMNASTSASMTQSSGEGVSTSSTGSGPTSGTILWASSFGGPDDDEAWGVAVTDAGDIYLAGLTIINDTSTSISIGKLQPNGTPVWTKEFPIGPEPELYARSFGLVADATGVIFAGNIDESGITIEGQPAEGAFAAKLDPDGNVAWVRSCGGQLSFESQPPSGSISFTPFSGDPHGAVIMGVAANSGVGCGTSGGGVLGARINATTGAVLAGLQFDDDGYERKAPVDSAPDGTIYVAAWGFVKSFAAGGGLLWERTFYNYTFNVAFDPESGGAAIVGTTNQNMTDFGGGPTPTNAEGFIVRYGGDGSFIRQTLFGPPGQGRAVRIDSGGAMYVAAGFSAAAHFGDNQPYPVVSNNDGAIIKIDKDNNLIWKHHFQGEPGSTTELNAVALGTDRVLVFGHFKGAQVSLEGQPFVSNGGKDVVLAAIVP